MRGLRWLFLSAAIVVVDHLTKIVAVKTLTGSPPVVVIPGFFDFSLVYNTGAAFGMLNDADGWQNIFFVVIGTLVSAYLIYSLAHLKRSDTQTAVSFALILGGAIGNIIDRLAQGYVVDFIHWYYQNWHWPTFNIADAAITIGAVLLVMDLIGLRMFGSRDDPEEEDSTSGSI